jgi:hypothetical protein
METLVINIDNKSNAKQILNAIKLFRGVKNASLATDEQMENASILKACIDGRKTKKVSKETIYNSLK